MLHFTIDARYQNSTIVSDGSLKLSRLKWMGDGIRIHLLGAMTDKNRDMLNHMAMDLCVAHHIPVVSLRVMRHVRDTPADTVLKDSFLRGLFDDMVLSGYQAELFSCWHCGRENSVSAMGQWCDHCRSGRGE